MTTSMTKQRWPWLALGWSGRLFVVALFLFAAYIKIGAPGEFAKDIRSYHMFPAIFSNMMAATIPWIEVFTAGFLLLGLWRKEARYLILFTLVCFTALKTFALLMGRAEDCGCFGDSVLTQLSLGWNGVWLNLALITGVVFDIAAEAVINLQKELAKPERKGLPKAEPDELETSSAGV